MQVHGALQRDVPDLLDVVSILGTGLHEPQLWALESLPFGCSHEDRISKSLLGSQVRQPQT